MTNSIAQDVIKYEKYTIGFSRWVGQDSEIVIHTNKTLKEKENLFTEYKMKFGMHSPSYQKIYDSDGKSGVTVLYL